MAQKSPGSHFTLASGEGDAKGKLRGGQGRDNESATGLQRPAKRPQGTPRCAKGSKSEATGTQMGGRSKFYKVSDPSESDGSETHLKL